jgi:hypothetical protein
MYQEQNKHTMVLLPNVFGRAFCFLTDTSTYPIERPICYSSATRNNAVQADVDEKMDAAGVYVESSGNIAKIVLFSTVKKPKEAKHAIALPLEEPFDASSKELDMSETIGTPTGGMCHKLRFLRKYPFHVFSFLLFFAFITFLFQ